MINKMGLPLMLSFLMYFGTLESLYANAKDTVQKLNEKEAEVKPVLKAELVPLKQANALDATTLIDLKEINNNKERLIQLQDEPYRKKLRERENAVSKITKKIKPRNSTNSTKR